MSSIRLALSLFAAATVACSSASNVTGSDSGSETSSPKHDAGGDTSTPKGDAGGDTATPPGEGGGSGDTWNNFAKGFSKTYCVECHNPTKPNPAIDPKQDFNIYADVKGLDSTIRCGVAPAGQVQSGCPTGPKAFPPPGQFPISNEMGSNPSVGTNPRPSDADRLRMVAWINAGAPQ
jgi:hypothetical protein